MKCRDSWNPAIDGKRKRAKSPERQPRSYRFQQPRIIEQPISFDQHFGCSTIFWQGGVAFPATLSARKRSKLYPGCQSHRTWKF